MIKILINDEEVVSNSNLQINEEMLSTSSTILKNCYPKSWEEDKDYVSRYYFPKDYSKCKIYNVDENNNETLIFCGVVKNTGNISLNPREPHFVDLQILDFKTLLSEGETLNYVIDNVSIRDAIQQVIDSVADYGFVLGNINISGQFSYIYAYSTLDKTAYDVFQYIAEITQSRWATRMVDENVIAIDFFDPLQAYNIQTLDSTEQYYEEKDIVDISFSYSTNDYRNKQIMTSEEVYGSILQSETKLTDGYTKVFVLDNKIGTIQSLTINGTPAVVITKAQQDIGYTGDFVYTPGESAITSTNTLSSGNVLIINYFPIVKGRQIILNVGEITRINNQTNRKGTISRYENRNDATSSTELSLIGQSYIKYKGSAEISLKVVSKQDLFNVGEIVSYNSVLNELNTKYMVKSKQTDMYLNAGEVFFTFILSSNFNSEDAVNYFDNQRSKANGNIGEGETITRDVDIENTATIIFYETSVKQLTIDNPSQLDFTLEGDLV